MNNTTSRTLKVLSIVSSAGYPMTLKQISDELNAPVSSIYDIVNTMLQLGYLQQKDVDVKQYTVGIKAYEAGVAYLRDIDVISVARPFLETLCEETSATAFLAVRDKDRIVYLDKVESSHSVRTTAALGSSRGMYYTGLGKALLAEMPPAEVRELYAGQELEHLTPYTIVDIDALEKELMKTRMRGYAIDDREGETMLYCLAAAVRDAGGGVAAAISVACFQELLNDEKNSDMPKLYCGAPGKFPGNWGIAATN